MIRLEDRRRIVEHIESARRAGARLKPACELAGIDARTCQRWKSAEGLSRALGFAQRMVPILADEGEYLASESTWYRVLREADQLQHRGRAKAPQPHRAPTTHVASAPNEVWCWDMTYLPLQVVGLWLYLYLIVDLYSRKIVGWELHGSDSADHAVELLRRTALSEGIHGQADRPVLHGDNGATLKATTVLTMLHWLGIKPSYSRPRVSDDNAYAEALFRTAKYRPEFPAKGFASLEEARAWAARIAATDHRS